MKRQIFIPAVILFTALNAAAQQHQNVEAASMKQPGSKKLLVVPSFQAGDQFKLSSDGAVTGYVNNQLLFSGTAKRHKLNGRWVSFYATNSLLDSGYLDNGTPDGEWKRWDSTGQLIAIRNYDTDKLQRVKEEMRLNHPKRNFYSLAALYRNSRQQALYYLTAAYSFSFPQKQGPVKSLQELVGRNSNGGNPYNPVFSECLHHGLYMNFFPGGITKDSGYYRNGLREAIWLHRNSPTGYYLIGAYKNGLPHREWKQYDAAGRLQSIIFYNKGGQVERTKKISR